jgi:hypothetical protein
VVTGSSANFAGNAITSEERHAGKRHAPRDPEGDGMTYNPFADLLKKR